MKLTIEQFAEKYYKGQRRSADFFNNHRFVNDEDFIDAWEDYLINCLKSMNKASK